jgi:pyrroline-5-carboxylate reductase
MSKGKFTVALIGAGNMGGAMLEGWLADGFFKDDIVVIDPSPNKAMAESIDQNSLRHETTVPANYTADVIIIALKPQIMDTALPALQAIIGPNTVSVSVAAGKTLAGMAASLGDTAIIRAMPNTPAQVRRAITVCVGNEKVTLQHQKNVTALLKSIGQVEWIDDEALIDAVTGLSGSGPAYVFHLVEAMSEAGQSAGLSKELADTLAKAAVCGAGELMFQSPLEPGKLRENVTSPNGTTQAALEILMDDDGLTKLMTKAVHAATKRAGELAG